jgi:hypothetical protein
MGAKLSSLRENTVNRFKPPSATSMATSETTTTPPTFTTLMAWTLVYLIFGLVSLGIDWNLMTSCQGGSMRILIIMMMFNLMIMCLFEYRINRHGSLKMCCSSMVFDTKEIGQMNFVFSCSYFIFNCIAINQVVKTTCPSPSWITSFIRTTGGITLVVYILVFICILVWLWSYLSRPKTANGS